MLLWRIGTNALTTYENLMSRSVIQNLGCVLCSQALESSTHLFINCPFVRGIWFASYWGFKPDEHAISSCEELINILLDPLLALDHFEKHWNIPLNMAFILDEI